MDALLNVVERRPWSSQLSPKHSLNEMHSEPKFSEEREKRNAEYLAKIDRGIQQMQSGKGGKYFGSIEEMREYFYGSNL